MILLSPLPITPAVPPTVKMLAVNDNGSIILAIRQHHKMKQGQCTHWTVNPGETLMVWIVMGRREVSSGLK